MKPRTLRGRLALWYALVLVAALLAFTAIVYVLDQDDVGSLLHGREEAEEARNMLGTLAIALPAALAIAVAGGLYITRRALLPLEEIAELAATLEPTELDRRVEVGSAAPEELQRLAHSLNEMLARLSASVATMRRFTADAAHELRTPLASASAELELALSRPRTVEEMREAVGRALERVGRLAQLSDALLELSRAEGAPSDRPAPIELERVTREVVDAFRTTAEARDVKVALSTQGELLLSGEPVWIERAVVNLVDNACKYCAPAGRVDVALRREGHDAVMVVENDLVAEDDVGWDRVFERFYRAPSVRPGVRGFGLGLALVEEIARRHGGSATLERTTAGRARATLRLSGV